MRTRFIALIGALALLVSACTGESDRPVATGEAVVRAVNAISTSPDFLFAIEERSIGPVTFSSVSNQNIFDDLDYTFNFEVRLPDFLETQRVASTFVNVERDHEYTFVISGDVEAPTIILWDDIQRVFTETDTVFQTRFAHTAESLGAIDVYFTEPGIAPAAGQAVATLSFGELSPAFDYAEGNYVYTFTTAGNPGDILFESEALTAIAQSSFIITPFDGTANNTGPFAVRVITDGGNLSSLTAANELPTIRFIHASLAMGAADIYTDELLTDQILANHTYRDASPDLDLASGTYTFTYTDAGNPGSILLETGANIFPATRAQLYVVGEAGSLGAFIRGPDRRSVETVSKFTFTHAAFNHPAVDLYVVEAGSALEDTLLPEFFNVTPGSASLTANIDQGELEMYLTVSGEKTIITGPVPFSAALGDVLEYIAYDNVDPATADLVAIPLP
jgi:hypothetical protein